MLTKDETFSIRACPLCGKEHTYRIQVTRSVVARYESSLPGPEPAPKIFDRIFPCPAKGKMFQAQIIIRRASGVKIKEVVIVGPDHG
jgi:predicted RNA-binding Zn-ribbon protein involved in translation (DUF1610 family)